MKSRGRPPLRKGDRGSYQLTMYKYFRKEKKCLPKKKK